MLPFAILPRPSLLTTVVVAASVAAGLAFGLIAGGAAVMTAAAVRAR